MPHLSDAPILKNRNWRFLLRGISNQPWGRPLASATQVDLRHALLGPASAARAIATLAPELAERPRMKMLVAGAAEMDCVDQGRWYRAVGHLLGRPDLEVEPFVIGPEVDRQQATKLARVFEPAPISHEMLAPFLARHAEPFDVVFFFTPGFSAHPEWFEDGAFQRLFESGAVLLASAYEESELPDEVWLANLAGIGQDGDFVRNPFTLLADLPDGHLVTEADRMGDSDWGSILWRLKPVSPTYPKWSRDWLSAAAYQQQEVCRVIDIHDMEVVQDYQEHTGTFGHHCLADEFDYCEEWQGRKVFLMPEASLLFADTGEVFSGRAEDFIPNLIIPREVLDSFPTEGAYLAFPRIIWALSIWTKYVNPNWHYDPDLDPEEWSQPGANDMLGGIAAMFESNPELLEQIEHMMHGEMRKLTADEKRLFALFEQGEIEAIKREIAAKPTLATAQDEEGKTPLYYSSYTDDAAFAGFLLAHGADIEHRDGQRWTPIMFAASCDAENVIRTLSQHRADVNAQNPAGFSPLLIALPRRAWRAAQALLDAGADPNHKTLIGTSVKDYPLETLVDVPPALVERLKGVDE